jgi:uncharacterized repeat protein (TIGR03803 family)
MGIYCLLVGVQPENARLSLNCIVRHGEKEDFMDENRQHQTKPTVSALGKLTRGKRAYAVLVLCATTAMSLPAQTLTTLYSFLDSFGSRPPDDPSGLIQATGGNLYGTTFNGGANGSGTVFRITPSGMLTTLYSFCPLSGCLDGGGPYAGLVQATNGDLYGTTCCYGPHGAGTAGTVFKITPSGTLTTLHSFCSQTGCPDGAGPYGALVQATNGDLYGTTSQSGAYGGGTVFKITPSGTLTTLHSFCSQTGCPDGSPPTGLVQAASGDFYGTTMYGGASGLGTIFRITPSGTLATLYSFVCSQSACPDGTEPSAGLVQATDGNLYGTANGGANAGGTIFKITPSGTLTTLYSFCFQTGCTDGAYPSAGLVQATNGNFYGTTSEGGIGGACTGGGCGTVFRLSVGLGPFVITRPTSGEVGAAVMILGTDLTGATSVSFNGTAATFTVVSRSLITTTIPAGATTGFVTVATPTGTLKSNVKFRVP